MIRQTVGYKADCTIESFFYKCICIGKLVELDSKLLTVTI